MSYIQHGNDFISVIKNAQFDQDKVERKYCDSQDCKGIQLHIIEIRQDRSADEGVTTYSKCIKCSKFTKVNT